MMPNTFPNAPVRVRRRFHLSPFTVMLLICIVIFIAGLVLLTIGYVNDIQLSNADYAAQLATYGYYKEDVHVLENYRADHIHNSLMIYGGWFLIAAGLIPPAAVAVCA